ncbi:RagB/SusD family nutrient uptake outer membrane protein [Pedobacter sp. ISL-68]|uniref:RagB/SusD family nutrient uptake outer membrane protein n=1 Tax=unclassified Pedobacter TaxID=2628915 RepID=UPI001BED13FF|nr:MULTISPECIES: RagB/SusD family nutrient uptake outer membrane protein [unclassified Pedobacter]MBT2563631.1 RagB/SusD family nutrient uptake outer membrane protein [Pedobacter sp. ISL-64]MBT2589523.1 RagB/SusD family nutrient uptake outer membrane protein [Pedobacter sp. ISL-68]
MKNKSIIYTALALFVGMASACTNLDENAYDVIPAEKFYTNKNEVISAVLRPYTHANAWVTPSQQDGWWRLAELSADQLAWPTKGPHGEDGGKWKRLHYHSWTVDEGGINNAWALMYGGVGYCNDPIANIGSRDISTMGITQQEKDGYIAELKLLRAFHYLKLMDLFGNIPLATDIVDPANPVLPNTTSRKDVFAFIEKEIKDNINAVPKLSKAQLGRMSQASGYAMLVELYLNAEVWTGTPRWDECIAAADKLINNEAGGQNGNMDLDPNISDQFKNTNDLSKEVIFSIAYDFTRAKFEPSWTGEFYHFAQRDIYGGGRNGNDGIVLVPGVYETFKTDDLRKTNWLLFGPQFKFTDPASPVLGTVEYAGKPLSFVDNIQKNTKNSTVSNMSEGEENSGVRFNKYKLGNSLPGIVNGVRVEPDPNYNNTDWNVYRLTWIYFAKAEAIMRKNGGVATADAVALINTCKKRAYTAATWPSHEYTTASLSLDELLAERGREFIFEGFRRDDLIRFSKFTTTTWWDHTASSAFRNLYPIPQRQRDLNTKLTQNPGY